LGHGASGADAVGVTERGAEAPARSARAFERVRDRWERELGADRLAALEEDLRGMTPAGFFRLDAPGWFGNV